MAPGRAGGEAGDDLGGCHTGRAGTARGGGLLRRPPRHPLHPAGAARLAAPGLVRVLCGGRAADAGLGARNAADHRRRHLRDQRERPVRGQRGVSPGPLDPGGPGPDAAPGPHDDLLSHRGHGHSGAAADLARPVRAGLPDHGVDAGRRRGHGPPEVDERAGTAGRRGLRRAGLGRRPGAARHLDPRRRGAGRAGPGRRPALHRRGAVLPPPPARPVPVGVRLPRGLPRLRLPRRDLPVRRDCPADQLITTVTVRPPGLNTRWTCIFPGPFTVTLTVAVAPAASVPDIGATTTFWARPGGSETDQSTGPPEAVSVIVPLAVGMTLACAVALGGAVPPAGPAGPAPLVMPTGRSPAGPGPWWGGTAIKVTPAATAAAVPATAPT